MTPPPAAWEASKALLYFLHRGQDAPYTAYVPQPRRVVPARCKTGVGTPRSGTLAHRIAGLAAVAIGDRVYFGARWNCGLRSADAVLLADETSHGGPICFTCDPAQPTVYRCLSAEGDLLYVGSTVKRRQRMKAHAKESAWWELVDDVTYEDYPTIAEALLGERVAIRDEGPAFNVAGIPGRRRRR